MKQKFCLDLEDARRVAAAAEAEARSHDWPVVIAIVDDGGHLMYLQRDRAQLASIDVAIEKAVSALGFRRPTQSWQKLVNEGAPAYLGLPGALPIEGGVPLEHQGEIVGAIGISGVMSNQDGIVARAGAAAL